MFLDLYILFLCVIMKQHHTSPESIKDINLEICSSVISIIVSSWETASHQAPLIREGNHVHYKTGAQADSMLVVILFSVSALIASCGCEDTADAKQEQLLKFQIPLGFGASQLLETAPETR